MWWNHLDSTPILFLSSRSWDIGIPPTGGAGRMNVCVPCQHRSYTSDSLCEHCQCILTVCHILVGCNHLAQTDKDIFGCRDEVESFRFHPILVLNKRVLGHLQSPYRRCRKGEITCAGHTQMSHSYLHLSVS